MGKIIRMFFRKRRPGLSMTLTFFPEPELPKKCENCGAIIMVPKAEVKITVEIDKKAEGPVLCQVCKSNMK